MKSIPCKLLLALLPLFGLSACDKGEETARYGLSEELQNFIPYQAGDSIQFIHSGGYEFSLLVVSKEWTWEQSEREHPGDDYYSFQVETVHLSSFQPDLSISLEIQAQPQESVFSIEVNRYEFGKCLYGEPDIESLEFAGRIYHGVYFLEEKHTEALIISPDSVYYTKDDGIIKISMTNDEAYYLNN
jgi:hypothetical protein